jgi:hypothetical protein
MEEINIRHAAAQMIRLHGHGAELAAACKADSMLTRGSISSFHAWSRIAAVIGDLERKKPGPDDAFG